MALRGPILIIEDDESDAEVMVAAIKEIGVTNNIKVFHRADEAYRYLMATADKPFVILCDIRMGTLNGLSFRKKIIETPYLVEKAIPFIFFSVLAAQEIVNEAYMLNIQGFFKKPAGFKQLKDELLYILLYWQHAQHPKPMVK